jgi:hypothetical protein
MLLLSLLALLVVWGTTGLVCLCLWPGWDK